MRVGIAVVKLVVADTGEVIAGEVHELDGSGALGDADGGLALDVVAGVEQQDLGAAGLVLGLHSGDLGIGVNGAVDVVGVQDYYLTGEITGGLSSSFRLFFSGGRLFGGSLSSGLGRGSGIFGGSFRVCQRAAAEGEHHDKSQENR